MTLAEVINRMVLVQLESANFTSASPDHINKLINVESEDSPDLETEVQNVVNGEDEDGALSDPDFNQNPKKSNDTIKKLEGSNLGDMSDLSSQQVGNIKNLAQNPVKSLGSTFTKFAKIAGPVALAAILWETVQFIISELLKSGRLLDRKFKRDIRFEILAFKTREEKQNLKQGFARIIVTSMPRLRGGQFQVYDSFRQRQSQQPVFREGPFNTQKTSGSQFGNRSKGKNAFTGN